MQSLTPFSDLVAKRFGCAVRGGRGSVRGRIFVHGSGTFLRSIQSKNVRKIPDVIAHSLALCVKATQEAFQSTGIVGEVIVVDNGSTDNSAELAVRVGAKVVYVGPRGYGNALRGGLTVAQGDYLIIGDADGSYDFSQIPQKAK